MPTYYHRTSWYGLSYLIQLKGSLLPRCLPYSVMAGAIAGVIRGKVFDELLGWSLTDSFGEDVYGMQVFGIVFGYLMIARLNISYHRFWEGSSHVKMMHSKWADACSQAIAFDRIDDHGIDMNHEPFCNHVVQLFSQLSAMATLRLHVQSSGVLSEAMDDTTVLKKLQVIENASCKGLNRRMAGLVEQSRHSITDEEAKGTAALSEPTDPSADQTYAVAGMVTRLSPMGHTESRECHSSSQGGHGLIRRFNTQMSLHRPNLHAPSQKAANAVRRRPLYMQTKKQHKKEDMLMSDSMTDEKARHRQSWVAEWLDGWMARWLDGWRPGWLDDWMTGRLDDCMAPWPHDLITSSPHGVMVPCTLAPWRHGAIHTWLPDHMAPWPHDPKTP